MTPIRTLTSTVALCIAAAPALAETPKVMADIAPVHSLVARVMQGVGAPDLLLPPGASPHDFALRPSDAARLADADLVVWVGHGLTPWLEAPLDTLASDAVTLELLETEGWPKLAFRVDANFADDHDDHDPHDGEDHDDHEDHDGHDDHEDDHGATGEDAHAHDHSGTDPHAWLDPAVAAVWLDHVAAALSAADPDNADAYRANAAAGQAEYAAMRAAVTARMAPLAGRSYLVPHDGYQYFEVAFGLPASGAIALSDAATPGPARIAELRDLVQSGAITCILSDPQTSEGWTDVLRDATTARTALADPIGGAIATGPDLYPALIAALADALENCLQ